MGVQFASFCGAVIVGKVTRAKSTAAVRFSERILIRFGTGVMNTDDDDDRVDDRLEKPVTDYERRRTLYPCPVLEFRLANFLYENSTGEILNSKISVVGNTRDEKGSEHNSVKTGNGGSTKGALSRMVTAGQFIRRQVTRSVTDIDQPGQKETSENDVASPNNTRAQPRKSMIWSTGKLTEAETAEGAAKESDDDDSVPKEMVRFRGVVNAVKASQIRRKQTPRRAQSDAAAYANNGHSRPKRPSFILNVVKTTETDTATGSDDTESATKGKEVNKEKMNVLRRLPTLGSHAIESVLVKNRLLRSTAVNEEKKVTPPERDTRRSAICVEEDPTGGLMPRSLYSNVSVECDTQPFLKRIWTIRHVLNAESPLLSERAVRIIKESRGLWPAVACNSEFIRENVDFQQLIVSVSGTKDGTKVFALHLYDYRNLHVGYTFVPILQPAPDGRLRLDFDNIDTIREQRGGGAEPIDYEFAKMRQENFRHTEGNKPVQSSSNCSLSREGPSEPSITNQLMPANVSDEILEEFVDDDESIESF